MVLRSISRRGFKQATTWAAYINNTVFVLLKGLDVTFKYFSTTNKDILYYCRQCSAKNINPTMTRNTDYHLMRCLGRCSSTGMRFNR
jgi:hypothetical protein